MQRHVPPHQPVEFLGVDFDPLDFAGAVAWLQSRTDADPFAYVVTPNVDHLVRLERERAELAPVYRAAALRLCDSRIVSGLGKSSGVALPVVPGSDLVAALFDFAQGGDTIRIIGGSADIVERVRRHYPALVITHVDAPMGLRRNAAARAAIAAAAAASAPARYTLIAIGSPQQELLAHEMLGHPGMRGTGLCIGASVEFIVGEQRRAPRIVQQLSMEWAWRLASDPRRLWRRYLIEGPAIFVMAWKWRRERGKAVDN